MPSSRGIKKTSSGKVGYKINGTKEKRRKLPPLKEGQGFAPGLKVAHKAFEILRNTSKTYTAKLNKLMRQVSTDALKYTQADGPMLNAVATIIQKEEARFKTGMDKMMSDVRGSGLNMGQTGPRKKLSNEDYVAKYKDTAIEYGCDRTEFDDMTLPKQKKMILSVKSANKQGLHIPVDQLLQKYKDSKAPRKPKAGSTAPKAPTDWKYRNWGLLTAKAKKDDTPPTLKEGVMCSDAQSGASPACKMLMLLVHIKKQPPVHGAMPAAVAKKMKTRSDTLEGLSAVIDKIKTTAGAGASLEMVAEKADDEFVQNLLKFLRTEMGLPPTTRAAQTRVVKKVDIKEVSTSDKLVDDMIEDPPVDTTGVSCPVDKEWNVMQNGWGNMLHGDSTDEVNALCDQGGDALGAPFRVSTPNESTHEDRLEEFLPTPTKKNRRGAPRGAKGKD